MNTNKEHPVQDEVHQNSEIFNSDSIQHCSIKYAVEQWNEGNCPLSTVEDAVLYKFSDLLFELQQTISQLEQERKEIAEKAIQWALRNCKITDMDRIYASEMDIIAQNTQIATYLSQFEQTKTENI